ncbi:MAG: Methylmalonyl-CoA mutase [Alphaproteobacteria bacterium MarineAlpha9_Bin4]|nr:methylmalonyl-CoA mutase [Pelagibacterales bacterium]PPR25787.1 MAG: Methylmalonyl-CoA mutase [Alphaproteobacteria bacterium MarineAlpha9_Bin4]
MKNFVKASIKDWKSLADKELKKSNSNKGIKWKSADGIVYKSLYTEEDLAGLSHLDSLPGFAPFLRGPKATMYTGKPWTIRQYAGFSTAEESNKFYKNCLKSGQKGLSIAFDLPTHRGYDSDHPRVIGDVGKAGVAIDSVEDMKVLFNEIPLDQMSVSMTMNGAVLPILAAYIVAAEEQGVDKKYLSGTIQNDILKEFLVRNTYIYPPNESLKIVSDIISYTTEYMPKFNSISISGYHMQEAGATEVQELAFTIADGIEYVKAAKDKGLKVDDFAPRLSFFFGIGMNFFMEIAKLRAARFLWAEKIKELFNPKDIRSLMLRTHCQTSGVSLTEKDAYNNIIRTTIEAMAAVMGGTQSLHTNSFDEAVALPTESSSRIARNTQLILQHETNICNIIDPLAGSYFIENLTNSVIVNAGHLIDKILNMGGMTKAIEKGFPNQLIEKSALIKQAEVDSSKKVIVGVNKYLNNNEKDFEILKIDNSLVIKNQLEVLNRIKKNRDKEKLATAINNLKDGAIKNNKNLLELTIEAMRARATVGEVSLALEEAYGRFEGKPLISKNIYSSNFDEKNKLNDLKDNIKNFKKIKKRSPKILVCKLGQDGHDRGAKVVASSFADLGFEAELTNLFLTPEELLLKAKSSKADVIGISSHAGGHLTLVPQFMDLLKKENENFVVVCGGVIPKEDYNLLKQKGVSQVFGPGTNLLDAIYNILNLIKYGKKSNI